MPIQSPIFAPAIVLVLWSLVMLGWLALSRLPAMSKAGLDVSKAVGSRGANLEAQGTGSGWPRRTPVAWG